MGNCLKTLGPHSRIQSHQSPVTMSVSWKHAVLLAALVGLAAAGSRQEDGAEAEGRAIFSNYTSGLLKLTTVNSTTYSLVSLIVGGAALAIAFIYLYTVSPAFQTQFQSHYRSFTADPSATMRQFGDLELLGLVSRALKVYERLEDEE